jgi:hypothetical protein
MYNDKRFKQTKNLMRKNSPTITTYYYCPSLLWPYVHMSKCPHAHMSTRPYVCPYGRVDVWTYGHVDI